MERLNLDTKWDICQRSLQKHLGGYTLSKGVHRKPFPPGLTCLPVQSVPVIQNLCLLMYHKRSCHSLLGHPTRPACPASSFLSGPGTQDPALFSQGLKLQAGSTGMNSADSLIRFGQRGVVKCTHMNAHWEDFPVGLTSPHWLLPTPSGFYLPGS